MSVKNATTPRLLFSFFEEKPGIRAVRLPHHGVPLSSHGARLAPNDVPTRGRVLKAPEERRCPLGIRHFRGRQGIVGILVCNLVMQVLSSPFSHGNPLQIAESKHFCRTTQFCVVKAVLTATSLAAKLKTPRVIVECENASQTHSGKEAQSGTEQIPRITARSTRRSRLQLKARNLHAASTSYSIRQRIHATVQSCTVSNRPTPN